MSNLRARWSLLTLLMLVPGVLSFTEAQTAAPAPNLLMEIAGDWLNEGAAQEVDDEAPVNTSMSGASVAGMSRTQAQSHLELVADPDRVIMEFVLTGSTAVASVAYSGPVRVYVNSAVPFTARKRALFDQDGVSRYETSAQAQTQSTLTGIDTDLRRLGDRIARRAACRKYAQGSAEADWNASRQAEAELRARLDKEIEPQLQQMQDSYFEELDKLYKRGVAIESLAFSSSNTAVHMRGVLGTAKERKLQTPPPAPPGDVPMGLRVHQSLVNHFGSTYASKTIDGDNFEKDAASWFGPAPEAKKPKAEEKPWSITFVKKDPFTMTFADHGFVTVMRLKEFTSGDSLYDGMNVTANYRFQKKDNEVIAVRQGRLAVFPPGFVPDSGMKLSARQQTIRTVLEKRMARVFSEEMHFKDIQPNEDLKNMSPLKVASADAQQGWLVMSWRRTQKRSSTD